MNTTNQKIINSKEIIKKTYMEYDMPFILAYSGGKDSSTTVDIFLVALKELQEEGIELKNDVFVISSNTWIENPAIEAMVEENIALMNQHFETTSLPVKAFFVEPEPEDSFWSLLIGRGYPSPNQMFRWCTDRLKIKPVNDFITNVASEWGSAIVVLGVRGGESNSRDRVIEKRNMKTQLISPHPTLTSSYTSSPILEFDANDVWFYLMKKTFAEWGYDFSELAVLYGEGSGDECPLMTDQNVKEQAGSCGQSRFGCWTCTVVGEDKSLSAMISKGWDFFDLLEFRNFMADIRDDRAYRNKYKRNGNIYFLPPMKQKEDTLTIPTKGNRSKEIIDLNSLINNTNEKYILVNEDEIQNYIKVNKLDLSNAIHPEPVIKTNSGHYTMLGLGSFNVKAREELLTRLLKLQAKFPEHKLIREQEILQIDSFWQQDGVEISALKIYEECTNNKLETEMSDLSKNIEDLGLTSSDNALLNQLLHLDQSNDDQYVKKIEALFFAEKNIYEGE